MVLLLVVLQIFPKVVSQCVLVQCFVLSVVVVVGAIRIQHWFTSFFVDDFAQLVIAFGWQINHIPIKLDRVTKPDNQDALAVLRHKVGTVDDLVKDLITQLLA